MTSGTKSFLFGCHQFILHPLFVTIAWKKYYKKFPNWREFICILIHDIGVFGINYLNEGEKDGHWIRGAQLSYKLFGWWGFYLVAGHTDEGVKEKSYRSSMFIPDKISFLYAPMIWLKWCQWMECFNKLCTAEDWVEMVRKNMEDGFPRSSHEIYLDKKIEVENSKNGN